MAARQKQKRHHSHAQRRNPQTNEFQAKQSDDQLYRMVAAVARDVLPDTPERLGQELFNRNRERVAEQLDEPAPPKANAIYLRLNRGRKKGDKGWRSWKQIVEHALEGKPERRVSVDERAEPAWFQDEGYLVYSLRRIAHHLGIEPGGKGCAPDLYDQTLPELLARDRRLRRGHLLGDLLLTSAQIKRIADKAGWDGAWQLAGYLPPLQETRRGFDPLRMLAYYYETKPGLPRGYQGLKQYAGRLDIPMAGHANWAELRNAFIKERAEKGLETPKKGPLPEQALSKQEIAALLDGAPRKRRKGHWHVLENVVDALADYVDEYEGQAALRQHHYKAVCVSHGWPSSTSVDGCARKHEIGTGPGESPWRAMLELGRKHALERRQKAA